MLEYVLEIKVKPSELLKNVNYDLYLFAHKGSGFDSYVVSNNLPQWRTVVNLSKNGSGIVSPSMFNGKVDQSKKFLSMFIFQVAYCTLNVL